MPLKFISHKEIAFRQLLGLLRTPPQAVMSYYSNLFLSAKFVLNDDENTQRYIDKEIRRIEVLVGYQKSTESDKIMQTIQNLTQERSALESQRLLLEGKYGVCKEEEREELSKEYEELNNKITEINNKEYYHYLQIQPLMNLKQIETYMENNVDLKSYFKENGVKVYQMQIFGELDKLKLWIYQEATQMMPYIRFTKMD